MRYFKYKNRKKTKRELRKALIASLGHGERKSLEKSIFLNKLAQAGLSCVAVGLTVLSAAFARSFSAEYKDLLSFLILTAAGQFLIFVVCEAFTFVITALISSPVFNSAEKLEKRILLLQKEHIKEISQAASAHIRKFYGVSEPCMVTKCYVSTESKFQKQDVFIFECGDEIRIAKSLYSALNLTERDAGCYAFKKGEFTLRYTEHDGKRSAELSAGAVKFIFAARAKPFIEKLLR